MHRKAVSLMFLAILTIGMLNLGYPVRAAKFNLADAVEEVEFGGIAVEYFSMIGAWGWTVRVDTVWKGPTSLEGSNVDVYLAPIPDPWGYLDPDIAPGDKVDVYGLYGYGEVKLFGSVYYYIVKEKISLFSFMSDPDPVYVGQNFTYKLLIKNVGTEPIEVTPITSQHFNPSDAVTEVESLYLYVFIEPQILYPGDVAEIGPWATWRADKSGEVKLTTCAYWGHETLLNCMSIRSFVLNIQGADYPVHLESRQNTSSSITNVGTILFDGQTYSLSNDVSKAAGSYSATYNPVSGYMFDRWETTPGVSVSSAGTNPTTVTVSGAGTLRAVYKVIPPTPYSVHLESRQNDSSSYNKGTIRFDGVDYSSLPSDISKAAGSYSVSYTAASGYQFDHWETSIGISVTNQYQSSTIATVSSSGTSRTLTAIYFKRQGPSISEVKAFYTLDSFFLGNMPDLVKPNQYFVKGSNIAKVEFSVYLNGVKRLYEDTSPNTEGWFNSESYDMAQVTSNLVVTAYNSAGDSAQRTVETNVFDTPFWLSAIIYYAKENKLMNFTADPGYGFDNVWKLYAKFKWPQKPINKTVNIPLPIIGGKYGINATFSFTLSLQSNKRVTAEGLGEFEFAVADREGGAEIYAKATIKITDRIVLEDFFVRVGGSVTISISQDYSWDLGWPIGKIGVEVGVDVTGAVSVTFHVHEASDGGTFCDGLDWVRTANDISLTLHPYATIGIGIGEITVEGEGTVTFTVHVPEPYFTYPDDLSLEATVTLTLKIKGLPSFHKTILEYSSGSPVQWKVLYSESGWINRTWATGDYAEYTWVANATEGTYLQNVYLYANPSVATFEDTGIMVWTQDDLSKPYIQGYEVYYSLWDEQKGAWGLPVALTDNSLPEADPTVMFDSNGNAVAVWTVVNNPSLNVTVDPFSTLKDIELATAVWDRTTRSWSQPILMTTNDAYDYSPVLMSDERGDLMLAWMVDEDGDMSTFGDQSIYSATWNGVEWSNPVRVADPGLVASPVSGAYYGGKAVLAWAQHLGENATVLDDVEVFYSELQGSGWSLPKRLTNNALQDGFPSVAFWNGHPVFAWVESRGNETNALMVLDPYGDNVPKLILERETIFSPRLEVDSQNQLLAFWSDSSLPYSGMFSANGRITIASLIKGDNSNGTGIYCGDYNCSGGIVDINYDGKVDMKDISYAARRFQVFLNDPLWDLNADVNGDGRIDMKDISRVAKAFLETFSSTIHCRQVGISTQTEQNSVHLGSRQDTGATSNKGTTALDGTSYPSLPTDISKTAGSYQITYTAASGYQFDHWEMSGGISVANANSQSTTATVSGAGTLTAIYKVPPSASTSVSISPNFLTVSHGDNITVTVTASNVSSLYGWQVVVKYNASIISCTAVWLPPDNVFAGQSTLSGDPILNVATLDGLNYSFWGVSLLSGSVTFAQGVLFKMNFTAIAYGETAIQIGTKQNPIRYGSPFFPQTWYSFLQDPDLNEIPFTEVNGDILVSMKTQVTIGPHSLTVSRGENLTIAVTASNVSSLYGWQVAVKYNASIINCTGVWVPVENVFAGQSTLSGEPILNMGTLDGLNYSFWGVSLLSGSVTFAQGVLFKMNFTAIAYGETAIQIGTKQNPIRYGSPFFPQTWYSFLQDPDLNEIPFTEVNGDLLASR